MSIPIFYLLYLIALNQEMSCCRGNFCLILTKLKASSKSGAGVMPSSSCGAGIMVFMQITGWLGKCLQLWYRLLEDVAVRAQVCTVILRQWKWQVSPPPPPHTQTPQRISNDMLAWNVLKDFAIFQGEWKGMWIYNMPPWKPSSITFAELYKTVHDREDVPWRWHDTCKIAA